MLRRKAHVLLASVTSLFAERDLLLMLEDCLLIALCADKLLLLIELGPAAFEVVRDSLAT